MDSRAPAAAADWMSDARFKKVDLHCHSIYSTFKYFRIANTRDCYTKPEDVYRTAKARGMDYVTFTDHDSIDGCKAYLNDHPDSTDFFISEEAETWFPETRQRIHVNIFNLTEAQHREIARLRENIYDLVAYLQSEELIFSANHMFQNYRMRNSPRRYFEEMLAMFDVFEVKNGAMTTHHNRLVDDLMGLVRAKNGRVSLIAGSDAHTLTPLARVFTVAECDTLPAFLESVRSGQCYVWGNEIGFSKLITEVYSQVIRYYGSVFNFSNPEFTAAAKARHFALAAMGAPFSAVGVPFAITSLNYLKQIFVSRRIGEEIRRDFDRSEPH